MIRDAVREKGRAETPTPHFNPPDISGLAQPRFWSDRFGHLRFVPQPHPAFAAEPVDSFALQCSLMLAGCDVYLSGLAPETLSQICERLRARHGLQMPAL